MDWMFDRTLGVLPVPRVSKHNIARSARFKSRNAKRKAKRSPKAAKRLARRQACP